MPNGYPSTPMVSPMRYKRTTLNMMRTFKRNRPWRGNKVERMAKFSWLFDKLNSIYTDKLNHHMPVRYRFVGGSSTSYYNGRTHTITMTGKLSVVTALHEFAHAMGKNERGAVKWSVNLYRITFPRLFASMNHDRHMIRRQENES